MCCQILPFRWLILLLGLSWVAAGADAAGTPIEESVTVTVSAQAIIAATELESRQLIYHSAPEQRRDCSGIFHRLLDLLEQRCRAFDRPDIGSFRSSRSLAAWYLQQGRLTLVNDALAQDELIEPGVILFYGRLGKTYRRVDEEIVTTQTQHLGVVTAVSRDSQGKVKSYELFHGRSGRKPAAVTRYHVRDPRRSSYPPLGNGEQQWIAMARLCGKECRCQP